MRIYPLATTYYNESNPSYNDTSRKTANQYSEVGQRDNENQQPRRTEDRRPQPNTFTSYMA
jgi:hypothetical protein